MWLTDVIPGSFWPGFWVNVITLPLAILVTLLGITVTRRLQSRDEERKRRRQRVALLRLVRLELERNLKHIRGVREQGGIGPLIAGSEAWNAVRGELVSLSDPSDERFANLLRAVAEAHSWCASTMGIMDLNLQGTIRGTGSGGSLKRWLDQNVDRTEPPLKNAIRLIERQEAELTAYQKRRSSLAVSL